MFVWCALPVPTPLLMKRLSVSCFYFFNFPFSVLGSYCCCFFQFPSILRDNSGMIIVSLIIAIESYGNEERYACVCVFMFVTMNGEEGETE